MRYVCCGPKKRSVCKIFAMSGPVFFTSPFFWSDRPMFRPVAHAPMLNALMAIHGSRPKQYVAK